MGCFRSLYLSSLHLRGNPTNECADDRRAVSVPDDHAHAVRLAGADDGPRGNYVANRSARRILHYCLRKC